MTLYPWPCFFITLSSFLLPFLGTAITFAQILQPLCFRDLNLHLYDEYLQLFFALLTSVGVHIVGVLLAIRPHGE